MKPHAGCIAARAADPPSVTTATCDFEPLPGMPCLLKRGHNGIHLCGDIDIDAVYRRKERTS